MAKPIIKKIAPIDATVGGTYSISYSDGINKIETNIYNAETMAKIGQSTIVTRTSPNDIPIPTSGLSNGNRYAIECRVYDRNNNVSAYSDKVYFITCATPSFEFDGLEKGETADNKIYVSSLNSKVIYSQINQEPVSSYIFFVYNHGKNLINQTNIMYDVNVTQNDTSGYSCYMTYTYKGLESDNVYYIRCKATTKNGIELDTGYVKIFVEYGKTGMYSQISAYVRDEAKGCSEEGSNGIIKYTTNLIEVKADRDDYSYIDDTFETSDKLIDLTGDSVAYNKYIDGRVTPQFDVSGDYTIAVRVKDGSGKIAEISDDNGTGALYWLETGNDDYHPTLKPGYLIDGTSYEWEEANNDWCGMELKLPEGSTRIQIDYIPLRDAGINYLRSGFFDSDGELVENTTYDIPVSFDGSSLVEDVSVQSDDEDDAGGSSNKYCYKNASVDVPEDADTFRVSADNRELGAFKVTTYPAQDSVIFKFNTNNGWSNYNIYSDIVLVNKDSVITLYLTKKDQLYDLVTYVRRES